MSQARDFADSFSAVSTGRRNLITNGAMQVAQRGDITGASNQYTLDRFRINKSSTDNIVVDVTQDTDAPDGFSNSMKVDVTTAESAIASDERYSVEQRIEAQNLQHLQYGTSGAKTLTLSFWVKSSVTGKYGINIRHHDASVNKGLDYTINTADTWEYKQISFTGYTTTAINNDTGIGIWLRWMLIVGTDFQNTAVENAWSGTTSYYTTTGMQSTWGTSASHNFWLTGVQLEVGNSASPFEHRSFGEELSLCQRYFYAEDQSDTYHAVTNGFYSSTTNVITVKHLPVPMRVGPSLSVSGSWQAAGTTGKDASSLIIVDSTGTDIQTVQIRATVSGATAGQGTNLRNKNDATATFHLSAEL